MNEVPETDAALAGAEVELTTEDAAGGPVHGAALDAAALADLRESLPGWDVQPFQLSRAADLPQGVDALRADLQRVAVRQGRIADVLVTGDHLVVRVSSAGVGVTRHDVDLAAALDAVFPGSPGAGSDDSGDGDPDGR